MATLKRKFYLGVEGGATKSTAVLTSDHNQLLNQQLGKSLSYQSEAKATVKKNLRDLLAPLLKKTARGKIYAVFGLAGLDTKRDEIFYNRLIGLVLPKGSVYTVMNDAQIGLEAKCPQVENRILVIAGTGSAVYGESKGKIARSIGWDFILGDEGSGYDIGLKTMKGVIRSWDGRGDKTVLEQIVLQHTNTKTMEDFIDKVYTISRDKKQSMKYFIASFGPLLNKAIEQHDSVALQIRKEVVEDLTQGVKAVANKLRLTDKQFCIGTVGSVWKMPGLQKSFQNMIKRQFPLAQFSQRTEGGEWGAVRLAKQLAQQ